MTRAVTKTITFPFAFKAYRGGTITEANQITVCEPSYDKRHVYRRMRGYMGEIQKGLMKLLSSMSQDTRDAVDRSNDSGPAVEPDLLEQARMTLGIDEYDRFCEFIQSSLTGQRSLGYVGNEDTQPNDRLELVEGTWASIADNGGLAAIDQILTAFASFFSGTASTSTNPTTTTTGSTPSLQPPLSPPARSRSKQA